MQKKKEANFGVTVRVADPKSYNLKAQAEEMTGTARILEKFGMRKMQESMTQENLGARIQRDSGLRT